MKISNKNFFRMLAGIAVIFGVMQIAARAGDRPERPERPGKKAEEVKEIVKNFQEQKNAFLKQQKEGQAEARSNMREEIGAASKGARQEAKDAIAEAKRVAREQSRKLAEEAKEEVKEGRRRD
jgi:hypothetical protein